MLKPNLTPDSAVSQTRDADLKNVFFNIYEGDPVEETDDQIVDDVSDDPQPTDTDKPDESEVPADNDGDDDEYEIVEVEEDDVLEDDEVIDEDLEEGEDDNLEEEGSEPSEDDEADAEDGDNLPAYLYHDDEEGRDIFLKAVDPATGESSIYLDRAAAERGLANQVAFIGELKKQVTETREASNVKIAELERELARFSAATTPEAATQLMITAAMPERFRAVDPTTLSDEDLRQYKNARLDAEIKVEREIRENAEKSQQARDANDAAQERADQHIRSRMTDLQFFGMKNVEDQRTIRQKMAEKPDGSEFDYSEIVTSVAKAFGNKVADEMLLSIVGGPKVETDSSTEEKPKAKKATPKAKPKAEQVEKVKRKVRRKKAKPTNSTPATPDIQKMGAKNILKDAFKAQSKEKKSI